LQRLRPALFLDRDGVIVENSDTYVRSWDDVVFIPAAIEALQKVASLDVAVVIVTNQAVVGKGIITLEHATKINQRIVDVITAHGGRIDAAYLCPHRSDEACDCRKPKPGMLLRAARDCGLAVSRSVMVGDAITDMQAGRAAGARTVLVRTGRGAEQLSTFAGDIWFDVADDLNAAINIALFSYGVRS
jgi:histidinol-phosphate phosphatase family protein